MSFLGPGVGAAAGGAGGGRSDRAGGARASEERSEDVRSL